MANEHVRISTIKAYVKKKAPDLRVSRGAITEIDKMIEHTLAIAIERARKDKRKTIIEPDVYNGV
jgi:histone H3/H4